MRKRKALAAIWFAFASILAVANPALCSSPNEYPTRPGVVVIKLSPACQVSLPQEGAYRFGVPQIDAKLDEIGATKVEIKFWGCYPPLPGGVDLTRYYNIYFPQELSVWDVCADLKKVDGVENADPWQIDKFFLDDNDEYRNLQYGLDLCQEKQAHDISTGDPHVPVAIVDSGVWLTHQDLRDNIWVNPGEDINGDGVITEADINGRDDDGDGYVDDFHGWDLVSHNNNPMDQYGHGTHCAGDACAATNNRVGIASIGYSCSIMAVRAGTGSGGIEFAYEGIQYAVRAGARVISCSWGGAGGNQWTADVINYAYEHDVLVFAAAGNNYNSNLTYPGCYEHVIGVAAIDANDVKPDWSSYGDWVDISAPGAHIVSTVPGANNNDYAYMDGTSMATPYAAGLGVLLRAALPGRSVDEIRALIMEGADNIDQQNPQFRGQLGAGRINAYRSLSLGNFPDLVISSITVLSDDNGSGTIEPGENAELGVEILNKSRGQNTDGLYVSLTTSDTTIEINRADIQYQDIMAGDSVMNNDEPFMITTGQTYGHTAIFTVTATANPGEVQVSANFEIVIGHPDVLIVDDDGGDTTEQYYASSVADGGRGWARWDVAKAYAPDANVMSTYNMVVWMTGRSVPPLDDIDRYQIDAAVQEGANVLLIGNMIGDDPANRELLLRDFGAQHDQDSVNAYSVEGISDDRPLNTGVQMLLTGGGGYDQERFSPSTMIPVLGADSLCEYHLGRSRLMGLAGVYRDDAAHHSRTAYLGFSFECVSSTRTLRSTVLNDLYLWFTHQANKVGSDQNLIPQAVSLAPPFPNPFNGMVRLDFSVPSTGSYRLAIYDLSGKEVALIADGSSPHSPISAAWNANTMASGIYYAKLSVPGHAPIEQKLVLVR
jgi:hypothetical protein